MVEIISTIYLVIGMLLVSIGPYRKMLVDNYRSDIETDNNPFAYMLGVRPKHMRLRGILASLLMGVLTVILWPMFLTSIKKIAKKKSTDESASLMKENRIKRQKLASKYFEGNDGTNKWKRSDTTFLGMEFEHDLSKITVKSDEFIMERGRRVDAVEQAPEYKAVIESVRKQADEELSDHPWRGGRGYCRAYWGAIKRILRDEHGIRWRSPSEMNIHIMYD